MYIIIWADYLCNDWTNTAYLGWTHKTMTEAKKALKELYRDDKSVQDWDDKKFSDEYYTLSNDDRIITCQIEFININI